MQLSMIGRMGRFAENIELLNEETACRPTVLLRQCSHLPEPIFRSQSFLACFPAETGRKRPEKTGHSHHEK
jgi:hypothetical protein